MEVVDLVHCIEGTHHSIIVEGVIIVGVNQRLVMAALMTGAMMMNR